ncbi:MAG TPA: peptide deformylase [Polyangia bacterium]|jgi:peptide deformylase|nr:peptide deformylase [Polyangia bacterium]
MALRSILRFPDAKLRQRSVEVTVFDDDLRQLVADMGETMDAAEGAGLAAIQVGAPMRLFIIDGAVAGGPEGAPPKVFINPEIVEISSESQTGDEGCLSFPGIFVPVKRGMKARVRAKDLDGQTFEAEGEALLARAFQHENDHLNGRLLIDQVGPVKREIIKRQLRKDLEAERADDENKDAKGGAASAG